MRSLILAEFPAGVRIVRDYDTSLPEIDGDREQLIQAVLNIVRNAAQACTGARARAPSARRDRPADADRPPVTIARRRHRLALELQVIDNGPGIPAELRERMFYPLVSGREGGTGLGLTLAQTLRAAPPRLDRMRQPAGADGVRDRAAAHAQTANAGLIEQVGVR